MASRAVGRIGAWFARLDGAMFSRWMGRQTARVHNAADLARRFFDGMSLGEALWLLKGGCGCLGCCAANEQIDAATRPSRGKAGR